MMRTVTGFIIGFIAGLAGVRRGRRPAREAIVRMGDTVADGIEALVDRAPAWFEAVRATWPVEQETAARQPAGRQARAVTGGILEDERIADQVRREWSRLGLRAPLVDATVVEGTLYVRGRGPEITVDAMLATARALPGVRELVDEVRRE